MGSRRLDPAPLHRRRRHGRRGRARRASSSPPAPRSPPRRARATNTLVVVFLRGAADGLRILVPNSADLGLTYLRQVRADLVPADGDLMPLPGTTGWALNTAMQPLYDTLWATGELGVRAGRRPTRASAAATSRRSSTSRRAARTPRPRAGSTARSTQLGAGHHVPRRDRGRSRRRCRCSAPRPRWRWTRSKDFTFPGWDGIRPAVAAGGRSAVPGHGRHARRGRPGHAGRARHGGDRVSASAGVQNGAATRPATSRSALKDLATMLRAEVGLQVATVDVGGWDTHTDEANDLDAQPDARRRSRWPRS